MASHPTMPGKYVGHFGAPAERSAVASFLATELPHNTLREHDLKVVELSLAAIEVSVRRLRDQPNPPDVIRLDIREAPHLASESQWTQKVWELVTGILPAVKVFCFTIGESKTGSILRLLASKLARKEAKGHCAFHELATGEERDTGIALAVNTDYDGPPTNDDDSAMEVPFTWGEVNPAYWATLDMMSMSTTLPPLTTLPTLSAPTYYCTEGDVWARGMAHPYPYIVADPPRVDAPDPDLDSGDFANLAKLGYAVAHNTVSDEARALLETIKDRALGMWDTSRWLDHFDLLVNKDDVNKALNDESLPRRYISKKLGKNVRNLWSAEERQILQDEFTAATEDWGGLVPLFPQSLYILVRYQGEQLTHRDVHPTPDALPPPDCDPSRSHFSAFLPCGQYSMAIQPGSHRGEVPCGSPWVTQASGIGDCMIMHSTTKHHGLPASATGATGATQGTQASQPLPECTVFCLFATDKQGSLVPENAVFTDDDAALPAIPPAATALGPCTIPSYTTTLMLGPHVGRATLGLVSPEYLESVLSAAPTPDESGNEPPVVCPYHPCWLTRTAKPPSIHQLEFAAGDLIFFNGGYQLTITRDPSISSTMSMSWMLGSCLPTNLSPAFAYDLLHLPTPWKLVHGPRRRGTKGDPVITVQCTCEDEVCCPPYLPPAFSPCCARSPPGPRALFPCT